MTNNYKYFNKKHMRILSGLVLIAMITVLSIGCTSKAKENVTVIANDMEQFNVWMNQNTVIKGNAHSGEYACKLDSTVEYAFGWRKPIASFDKKIPKFVKVNFFGYCDVKPEKVTLVFSLDSADKNFYWDGKDLSQAMTAGQWVPISNTFTVPANVNPNANLSIYVWNEKKQSLLLDDFEMELAY